MRHGGAGTWVPGSYDPQLHLYYFGTANPTPAFSGVTREGDNLYTSCIVALNVDTGKLAWYYQPSPHDTHDWDAAQTPIIVDGEFKGKPRKLLLDASRNGYFFVLDRVTGEHLLTVPFTDSLTWSKGIDKLGRPIRDPEKDASPGGALVLPDSDGIVNWQPPTYDPQTGLFYVATDEVYSVYYRTEPNERALQGLNGVQEQRLAKKGKYITAIDYKTGKIGIYPPLISHPRYHFGVARKACNSVHAGITQPCPAISPASLIEEAPNRCKGEFAGIRVLRSLICPSFHRKAVDPVASIEKPTTSPRLLIVLQQAATVRKAPGSVPILCMCVSFVHMKLCTVPSVN
jgi:hypothetical protein